MNTPEFDAKRGVHDPVKGDSLLLFDLCNNTTVMYGKADYRENKGFLALFSSLSTIAGNVIMGLSYSKTTYFVISFGTV